MELHLKTISIIIVVNPPCEPTMLIRKNTKAFKTILEIVSSCQSRPDREKLIRLYVTKAGHSIKDRISVEGIQGEAGLFYEMNYQAVLNNLRSSNHQLNQSDDTPGLYFFHSTSNKVWDETPFEFDEAIKKEFASLPELPAVRKKEKIEKFVLPTPGTTTESKPSKKEKGAAKKHAPTKAESKKATPEKKAHMVVIKSPRQPDYDLKKEIFFTDLDRVIFRHPSLSKKDVLDYYNEIAEYILPHLKDRPLSVRSYSEGTRPTEYTSVESLTENKDAPSWIQTHSKSKSKDDILCNDKEHLMLYVEMGSLEFNAEHTRTKSIGPDYIIIALESSEAGLGKAVDVALATKEILEGLKLSSFVKTSSASGLHIYIPLDGKSKTESCKDAAEYLCKLVRLKTPDLVTLAGSDDNTYGKVSLDYLLNEDAKTAIAPYSIMAVTPAMVATPLEWDEVNEKLQPEDFNPEAILKRLKQTGDPFESLFKKKANAEELEERLEENYSFLF
jgi:DNA ligase D-like protein (predicted polymerase)